MTIKKKSGRQEVIAAEVSFVAADIDATTFFPAIELPQGARITGGALIVESGAQASTTVDVGDSAVANRYANDLNAVTTGLKALVPTGYVTTGNKDIGVTFNQVPTQGAFKLCVEYVRDGRVAFHQGRDYRGPNISGA